MAIWVGHDGTLNDDEGDGPAVAGDPIEILALQAGYASQVGCCGDFYVGDDFSSALGSIGDALGSAFGGSGGGGAGGGSGSGDLGSSIGSTFGSLFGGSGGGSAGAAIGDVIGKVAKVAVPLTAKAISRASSSHAQAAQAHDTVAKAHTQLAQAHAQAAQTASQSPSRAPSGGQGRQRPEIDPKTRLNLVLSHLAKYYHMPPPSGAPRPSGASRHTTQTPAASGDDGKAAIGDVASFVSKLTKPDATQTSGYYVGDLASLFGSDDSGTDGILDDLTASLHRGFSSHAAHPVLRSLPQRSTYSAPHVVHTPAPYVPSVLAHRTYTVPTQHMRSAPMPSSAYGDYRQQGQPGYGYGYGQQGQPGYGYGYGYGYEQQGQSGYDYASPGTYQPVAPAVTYRPTARTTQSAPSPRAARQKQQADQAPILSKLGTFMTKQMGGPAYGGTGRGTGVPDEDLRNYQKGINKLYAYKVLVEDGIMGDKTKEATRNFQKWAQMPVTGNPDTATRDMLTRKLEEQRISQEAPSSDWQTPSGRGLTASDIDWGTVGTYAKKIAEQAVLPPPMRAAVAAQEELKRRQAEERVRQLEGTPAPEHSWLVP